MKYIYFVIAFFITSLLLGIAPLKGETIIMPKLTIDNKTDYTLYISTQNRHLFIPTQILPNKTTVFILPANFSTTYPLSGTCIIYGFYGLPWSQWQFTYDLSAPFSYAFEMSRIHNYVNFDVINQTDGWDVIATNITKDTM